MIFNTNYLIYMLPAFILMMLVQMYVRSAYSRWSRVPAQSRLQLQASVNQAYNVRIEGVRRADGSFRPRSR
jgi:Zn-dependent membrane protease YugP